jgi:SAM-dependent methyltransferase
MIQSPLTGSSDVTLLKRIAVRDIIEAYRVQMDIDASGSFAGLAQIELYRDNTSQYCFFYPAHVAGDGHFYSQLQKFDSYYMDWKWEHQNALSYITSGNKVLEIGSAKGTFLEHLTSKGIKARGLELNEGVIDYCKSKGIDVLNETIQDHAVANKSQYDVVCSFQVMEHIWDIKEVLEASVELLKPGGYLIVSVPNNKSFLGYSLNYLNMPPHHMGLWSKEVLKHLETLLPVEMVTCDFEPLQTYHFDYFKNTMVEKFRRKSGIVGRFKSWLFLNTFPWNLKLMSNELQGFTIQGVYRKR